MSTSSYCESEPLALPPLGNPSPFAPRPLGTHKWRGMARLLVVFLFWMGLAQAETKGEVPGKGRAASPWFEDITQAAGIVFQHQDGRSGERYYIETAASGGGFLDFDGDGDLDIYLINGSLTPGSSEGPSPSNELYENRDGHFVAIGKKAGVDDRGFGMGFCAGDFDGDGLMDLFVTNFGADRLFRSKGDGTFEEVSQKAHVDGRAWGTGCAFGDIDGDGDLDLYVANYVDFDFAKNRQCGNAISKIKSYCRPDVYDGVTDYLYINQGDGTFREEGQKRGLAEGKDEKGFGVLMIDIDNDDDLDILVANDSTMNRLYVNKGDGYFEEQGLLSGFGFNGNGSAESGMGIAAGDANRDGFVDIFVTNYAGESNTLYTNRGGTYFEDMTKAAGLSIPSLEPVGWGVEFIDFDNDGDLDLAVANGHVLDNVELIAPNLSYPQNNQLFANDGKGVFSEVTAQAGPAFSVKRVSRGLAAGDFNNDGRVDLLITNTNDGVAVLANRLDSGKNWLGLSLQGAPGNLFAIGARVRLSAEGSGRFLGMRDLLSGGSFLSQSDFRLLFGLDDYRGAVIADIRWPNGKHQLVRFQETGRYHKVTYSP